MNIIRYEPWHAARRARRNLDGLFGEHVFRAVGDAGNDARWVPAVDIRELDNGFVVTADLPGVDPGDIDISTEKGLLVLRGERRAADDEHGDGYRRTERLSGKFERRFTLPDTLDSEAITATSSNGVLTITIPGRAELQPRRIEIDVA